MSRRTVTTTALRTAAAATRHGDQLLLKWTIANVGSAGKRERKHPRSHDNGDHDTCGFFLAFVLAGRGVVATQAITAGTELFEEKPVVAWPRDVLSSCFHCLKCALRVEFRAKLG